MREIRHLMLVDDDEDDRDIFLSVISTIIPDAQCSIAVNGEDALRQLKQQNFSADLIFLDLNMPLMNGQQFLREMGKNDDLKRIPVIILSTSSDRQTIANTRELGAKDFITKPDKYSGWEETLRNVLTKPNVW